MTDPSYDAMRQHGHRVARMLADPECVGDVLLVAIGFARAVDLDDPPFTDGNLSTRAIAGKVYSNAHHPLHLAHWGHGEYPRADTRGAHRILDVIRNDIRRYQPTDTFGAVTCGRPMVERDTGRCGRNPHHQHIRRFTDPATGERTYVAACNYPAHKAWWTALRAENAAQLAATPAPVPPANCGGVLDRHLPEIDWWAIWRHLDPQWSPPPEGRTWTAPKLTLLVEDAPEPATAARPALTVVEGGWR